VLGYYPDWKHVDPAQLDLSLFTHVCHAFVEVGRDGLLRFPDDAKTRDLIRAAHGHKTRVILSLGGADSNEALVAQPTDYLADALARRVRDFGYDGIDVDWEAPSNASEGAKMAQLVQALRYRLPHALITMAVPADDWSGRWYDTGALLPYTDWLNVMTYDFCGPWEATVQHNAPYGKVAASMDYWKGRGWPPEKLMLGIPDYGRRIKAVKFGDAAPASAYVGDEVSYIDLLTFIRQGWKPQVDADAQAPYLVSPTGGELITYDDTASVTRKGALARADGLLGVFFWEITSDFDGKTHALAHAARYGWQSAAASNHG
jgi:chitinase